MAMKQFSKMISNLKKGKASSSSLTYFKSKSSSNSARILKSYRTKVLSTNSESTEWRTKRLPWAVGKITIQNLWEKTSCLTRKILSKKKTCLNTSVLRTNLALWEKDPSRSSGASSCHQTTWAQTSPWKEDNRNLRRTTVSFRRRRERSQSVRNKMVPTMILLLRTFSRIREGFILKTFRQRLNKRLYKTPAKMPSSES